MRRLLPPALLLLLALPGCKQPSTADPAKDKGADADADASKGASEPPAQAPTGEQADADGFWSVGCQESQAPEDGCVHYVLSHTGGASERDAAPLIIAIHGLGDDPRRFRSLLDDLDVKARVVYPRAIDDWEGDQEGWSWFPVRARDPDVEALSTGMRRASDALGKAIPALTERYETQGKAIVTGFSQGGMLSYALAVEHGALLSNAFPISGMLPAPMVPEGAGDKTVPPIVGLHGDADKAVAIDAAREAVAGLDKAGLEVSLVEYPGVGHAITPEMRIELHVRLIRAAKAQAEAAPG